MSKFKYFSETEQLRFDAISREKYINDQASLERSAKLAGRAEGRAEGEAIGLKEGERRKEAEILANLKAMGLSEEQIKQALGK
ncbi:MAG: hypothetical protein ACLS8P_02395 [[Eubacterium] siraeum]